MDKDRKIAALRRENAELREQVNGSKLVSEIRAGSLRLEAVEREGAVTFSMVFNNDLMAWAGESSAKLFSDFVQRTLEGRTSDQSPQGEDP